jgi:fucose permease
MAALLQVSINLIGGGLGPLITGYISDFFGSQHGLAPALAILMVVNVWSAGHYFYVAYLMRYKEAVLL